MGSEFREGKERKVRRAAIVITAGMLAVLAQATTVQAVPPDRFRVPIDGTAVVDQCGFPVQVTTEGQVEVKSFVDQDGTLVKQIYTYPGSSQVYTNLQTGAVYRIVAFTGPEKDQYSPDGGLLIGTGNWVLTFDPSAPPHQIPGLFHVRGRLTGPLDGSEPLHIVGKIIDICAQLSG